MGKKKSISPSPGLISATNYQELDPAPPDFEKLLNENYCLDDSVESIKYTREILSSLCKISSSSVHIFTAIRNSEDEIIDIKIQKVNCDQEDVLLEDVSDDLWKGVIGELSDFFFHDNETLVEEKDYSTVDSSGKLHWFNSKRYIFKQTDKGLPMQVLLVDQDITEKKMASIALQENQHFIKSIADSTPDLLYVIDLVAKKIIYINNAIYQLLHYYPEQITNTNTSIINLLFHPHDRETIRKHFESYNTRPHKDLEDMEYRLKDALGEWHYIRCRHSVLKRDNKGNAIQLLGIGQNVTDFKRFQEERIKQKLEQQILISQAILKTQEDERKRIAEALHNSLGQILYGAKLSLSLLDSEKGVDEKRIQETKKVINDLLEEAIVETKTISFELMPSILKDFGLETALKDLLAKKRQNIYLKSSIHLVGLKGRLDASLEITIFRIVQELINNSIKHAQAKTVDLYINKGSDYIKINLADDGIGFNKEVLTSQQKGFGLRNIDNRVKLMNGNFTIDSNGKKGTQISIEIPLSKTKQ